MEYLKWNKKYLKNINDENIPPWKKYEMMYALKLNMILWDDIPPNFGELFDIPHTLDYGVDLIDLKYTKCVQVKKYNNTSRITWSDICKFRTYAKDILEIDNMILATTKVAKIDKLADHKLISTNKIRLVRNNYDELLDYVSTIKLPDEIEKDKLKIEERSYLIDCYNILKSTNKKILNFQLPCGTGKTYIMLYMIQKDMLINNGRYIIFCPWVNLAKQTFKLFHNFNLPVGFIGDGRLYKPENRIIICVNMSVDKVIGNFRYKFIDEAHHLEDTYSKLKEKVNNIKSDMELNFTATFKQQDTLDYNLPIRDAIENGYISDYVINIRYFTNGDKTQALLKMVKTHYDWSPMFLYFNCTERCVNFSKLLNEIDLSANYLIGKDGKNKRDKIRYNLENNNLKILCLCGVYNEGISIDCLQTVVFADLRHSQINKIQISMRANRIFESKPFYRIVMPVIEKDFENKDIKDLIKTFSKIDYKIKDAIKNKTKNGRIRINIDTEEIESAKLLYEEVYDRMGDMIEGLTMENKINQLLNYVSLNNKIPSRNKSVLFTNGSCMGSFWSFHKPKCDREPFNKLLINDLLKNNYDEYLIIREKNKNKIELSIKDKINELLNYVSLNNKIPKQNKSVLFTNESCMGSFWGFHKPKCDIEPFNKLLTNGLLKNNYDEYLIIREKNKNKIKLSIEDKIDELLNYVSLNNKIPLRNESVLFTNGSYMGGFWNSYKKKCDKKPFDKLLTNDLLKDNYNEYLIIREKNKNKIKLSIKDKIDELLNYVSLNNKIPKQNKSVLFTNESCMGSFWGFHKPKCDIEPFNKLLTNNLLKDNYNEYLIIREKNKNKIKLSIKDKINELLNYVSLNNKIPSSNKSVLFTNGSYMGIFWNVNKKKCNMEPFNKLLTNDLLKNNYDEYLIKKEKNKNKIKLSMKDKINELLNYVSLNNKIPLRNKSVLFTNGSYMGGFWKVSKKKCDREPFNKLLTNDLLKYSYNTYLSKKKLKL